MKVRLVRHGVFTLIDDIQLTTKAPDEGFYWIDTGIEDLRILQDLFKLHDLAIDDCLDEEDQRPKLEIYNDHYFLVINSIRFDDQDILLREVNIFLGKHYIITVTKTKINELRAVKPVLLDNKVNGPDVFLYYLVDAIIDNYFLVSDRIEEQIEHLEEEILLHTNKSHLSQIISLRSEILWLRRTLIPQKELISTLNKKELRLIDDQLQKYFADIYENTVKIMEIFETFRELMGNLREAYQSSLSSKANETMRRFTAITTIFMPLTVVTGIYGMNFDFMPELNSPFGYYGVLGFMIALGTSMFILFRKKDWL
jgi:magnesium transporter